MSRPPPQPIFVHYGFIGGVTSCEVIDIDNMKAVMIGTGVGKCEVYDAETHMLLRKVYEDPERRSISSVGAYDDMMWVHIRNYGVIFIGPSNETRHIVNLNHCGYCRVTMIGPALVYPDTSNEKHYLHIVSMISKDQVQVSLKQLPLSLTSVDENIYVGDETGTVTRVSLQGKIETEVSLYKEPVFCIASTTTHLACGSSKPPLFLLETADICGERRKIDYPPRQVLFIFLFSNLMTIRLL
ncbi:unnamed protein product [Cylicocyclus nassatus]|uniref:Uncharacterized protein n=1 Tax=Cylicocyclus nassatus TaxID=53992 RepID=A0AA36GHG5_CYLNA|nr:unnamed protein product [Cylicocyclus nassatus]